MGTGALWGEGLVPAGDAGWQARPEIGIAVLGATGSVGRQALDVAAHHPARIRVVALAAGRDVEGLGELAARHRPRLVAVRRPDGDLPSDVPWRWVTGAEALWQAATADGVDLVVAATPGLVALRAVLAALELGRTVALANKEVLVGGGDLLARVVRGRGVGHLVPVDSEHVALHQCLRAERPEAVQRVLVTCSGGPFRTYAAAAMRDVTPEQALAHPNWRMGPLNTLNSATLMNKGLEVLEAQRLFGLAPDRTEVVVHPESLVHSLVELRDGSLLGQLGSHDMRLPIQYAMLYPERLASPAPRLDLVAAGRLTFEAPRYADFPSLSAAEAAGKIGGTAPAVLVAANEEAVAAFVAGEVRFPDIAHVVLEVLERAPRAPVHSVEDVEGADGWARRAAREAIARRR